LFQIVARFLTFSFTRDALEVWWNL